MTENKDIYIAFADNKIPKKQWVRFTRFLLRFCDFYQLVLISLIVEARLQQIKPDGVELEFPEAKFKR